MYLKKIFILEFLIIFIGRDYNVVDIYIIILDRCLLEDSKSVEKI